jgi:hypothetical protein
MGGIMEASSIILIIIGIAICITSIVLAIIVDSEEDTFTNRLVCFMAAIGMLLLSATMFYYDGYKKGQIDAYRGNYKYKMEIRYELKDSTYYTPKDTIYVKIK